MQWNLAKAIYNDTYLCRTLARPAGEESRGFQWIIRILDNAVGEIRKSWNKLLFSDFALKTTIADIHKLYSSRSAIELSHSKWHNKSKPVTAKHGISTK